jgi:glycine C-acetyltransferase
MPHNRLEANLTYALNELEQAGRRKGRESVITEVIPATGRHGPRYRLAEEGGQTFIRMNSNNYLGMSLRKEVIAEQEEADSKYGTGPGAVRFISGTWAPHVELEQRLARFHNRPAAMIFSSAYAAVMGVLPALIDDETTIVSDELNHNCIINAGRLARPKQKHVYRHLDMAELRDCLIKASNDCRRAIIVTDGIFSMRGDHAPLDEIMKLAHDCDDKFAENVVAIADDSHGVGAFGASGRGTEEFTNSAPVDLFIATLGKALGVNGGYVTGGNTIIDYLRETSPFYVYSNPITPGEAAAACAALEVLDSPTGKDLLNHLRAMTRRFEQGLAELGLETIPGEHPIVPLMVRDTERTFKLVRHLRKNGILATGLNYPVVPRGDEEIRFQISADHTELDIDEVLAALADFKE